MERKRRRRSGEREREKGKKGKKGQMRKAKGQKGTHGRDERRQELGKTTKKQQEVSKDEATLEDYRASKRFHPLPPITKGGEL